MQHHRMQHSPLYDGGVEGCSTNLVEPISSKVLGSSVVQAEHTEGSETQR